MEALLEKIRTDSESSKNEILRLVESSNYNSFLPLIKIQLNGASQSEIDTYVNISRRIFLAFGLVVMRDNTCQIVELNRLENNPLERYVIYKVSEIFRKQVPGTATPISSKCKFLMLHMMKLLYAIGYVSMTKNIINRLVSAGRESLSELVSLRELNDFQKAVAQLLSETRSAACPPVLLVSSEQTLCSYHDAILNKDFSLCECGLFPMLDRERQNSPCISRWVCPIKNVNPMLGCELE